MPAFNGQFIFGSSCKIVTNINPVARQENTYNGLGGVENLVLGQRGGVTLASGRIFGPDAATLSAVQMIWYSYYDGNAYVLVDNFGRAWPNVILETVEFEPGVNRDSALGFSQRYAAKFFHQFF